MEGVVSLMGNDRDGALEQLLVLQAQTGDDGAFEQLVTKYDASVTYYLRKVVGTESMTDDLLQETWLAVFRGIPKLKKPGAFRAWLFRIARDKAFRELRRLRKWPLSLDALPAVEPKADQEPEFTAEDVEGIQACIERLSPDHREVLLLRFLEGMPYEEIALVAGCPPGTVRSRLHYAKAALRKELEATEPERKGG